MKKANSNCSLSEEKLKELKSVVYEALTIDRQRLLVKFPFIGNILMRLDLVPVRDKRIMTAQTDGTKVYFSISFFEELKQSERIFVLAHEVFHCVLIHLTRCQSRDPYIFNIASDMEVNYCLSQQGSDMVAPKDLCWPPKGMEGKSAEELYDYLLKQMKKNKKSKSSSDGSDSSSGNSNCGGSDHSDGNNGNKTGKLEGQFDNHKFEGDLDDSSDGASNTVTDKYGEVGYDEDYKPRISKDFADRMREIVISEAQRCQRTQGHLPAGLESILSKLPKPELDWKTLLSQFVTSVVSDKRAWNPPSRRHIYNDMYFQSRRGEAIKIAVLVDTSGSCFDDLSKFFAELNSLLKTFGTYEMNVIQCDADVQDISKYSNENPFPIDDPEAIEVKGCGGSDFRPAFKALNDSGIENEVDCICAFTDGYIDVPRYAPSKPMLWILTKDGNEDLCNWGKKILFKT